MDISEIVKIIAILMFAFIIWRISLIFLIRVPKVRKWEIDQFQATLPKGFGYPYILAGTGFAINVEEEKLFLKNGNLEKIYPRSAIREINVDEGRYDINKIYGIISLISRIDCAVQNRKNKKDAFNNSGIFIQIADIDNPLWQIKISSPKYGSRCYEILAQFLDGTLKPYADYQKREKYLDPLK